MPEKKAEKMAVDYAIEQYDLDIKKVIKDIEKEIEKMKRGTRKKAG